jgi:hypothetical protein
MNGHGIGLRSKSDFDGLTTPFIGQQLPGSAAAGHCEQSQFAVTGLVFQRGPA